MNKQLSLLLKSNLSYKKPETGKFNKSGWRLRFRKLKFINHSLNLQTLFIKTAQKIEEVLEKNENEKEDNKLFYLKLSKVIAF